MVRHWPCTPCRPFSSEKMKVLRWRLHHHICILKRTFGLHCEDWMQKGRNGCGKLRNYRSSGEPWGHLTWMAVAIERSDRLKTCWRGKMKSAQWWIGFGIVCQAEGRSILVTPWVFVSSTHTFESFIVFLCQTGEWGKTMNDALGKCHCLVLKVAHFTLSVIPLAKSQTHWTGFGAGKNVGSCVTKKSMQLVW